MLLDLLGCKIEKKSNLCYESIKTMFISLFESDFNMQQFTLVAFLRSAQLLPHV